MPWLQISITVNQSLSELVESCLLNQGASSVTLSDAANQPVLEPAPGEIRLWPDTVVTGLFNDPGKQEVLVRELKATLASHDCQIQSAILDDQDWTRTWMKHFQAMSFGDRLWICPLHLDPPDKSAVNLRLDPGLAFGTGTHPTTALCLNWLDRHCHDQARLLDYGCGSGVLAIAALMLGVKRAVAVDIDDQALEATAVNAKTNQVEQRLELLNVEQLENRQSESDFNIVIANILSGPLIELAPALAGYTQPGGDIVLSGILQEQAKAVIEAYQPFFRISTPVVQEDWVLIHGKKMVIEKT